MIKLLFHEIEKNAKTTNPVKRRPDFSLEKFPSFFKGILSEKLVAGRIPFILNKGNLRSLQKRDFSLQTPG
jgi:hypothetical protein